MKNLTGEKFGKWTVISFHGLDRMGRYPRWKCLCDCGNEVVVYETSLKSGKSKSCGCFIRNKPEKLFGKKFGALLVISRNFERTTSSKIFYNCLCDCGKFAVVPSSNLQSNTWKSCGCLRKYSDRTQPIKNNLFRKYKKSARVRGIDFQLTFEEFILLIQSDCFYCGKKPSQYFIYLNDAKVLYNGIDRLDGSGKYQKGNVVSCCKECNYLKGRKNKEGFFDWLNKCHSKLSKSKENSENTEVKTEGDTLSAQRSLYWIYKNTNAKKREYAFNLNFEEFINLTQKCCFYCGVPPNKYFQKNKSKKGLYFNGLDRVDNNIGYELSNVVSCCFGCNESKSNLTQAEFFKRIKACYEFLRLGDPISHE